jgi:NAD(P)H dehydrogenase (quinone)
VVTVEGGEVAVRIAVTGANGQLGGQVVRLLADQQQHDVVALVRRKVAQEDSQTPRVSVAIAEYGDQAALRSALRDVNTLVFISSDGDATKVLLHHQNVIAAAADSGVAHVVALSSVDADIDSPFCYAVVNGYTEKLLDDSGCGVSVARASIYTEFFLRWLTPARISGEIRLPAGDGRISLVSRTDVGRCLAALALAPSTGQYHDLTGPEALDLAAIAALTGDEFGRHVRYTKMTPREHCKEMAEAGEEPWWMYAFSTMFESVRQGRWGAVTDEVARLTGRRPLSITDVLAERPTPSRQST